MVTCTQGCLTPKGHSGIDCLSPPWLGSWQRLALWRSSWWRGWSRERASRRNRPLIQCQLENLSQTTSSCPRSHSTTVALFIATVCSLLIIVFLQEHKPQVKCFLSTHLQVLQNNYLDMQSLAYNGEISQKHTFFLFLTRLSWDPIILWA